ncbi:hypothetical protein [Nocardioides sp.]|uniref:hypothetical protein n=1 Tax=Nocardioides sp. TaxID=35761 RepID=UPI002C6B64CA|nr:hypothetical protein [Nocardioides sp.]HVX53680.1 hypothetical protein [Nocardioides sp.]
MTTASTPPSGTASAPLTSWPVWVAASVTVAVVVVTMTWTTRFWRDVASAFEGANAVLVLLVLALPVLDDSPARRLLRWWSDRSEAVSDAWWHNRRLAAVGVGVNLGLFGHTVVSHVQWVADTEPKSDWWAWLIGAGVFVLVLLGLELRHSPTVRWKAPAFCLLLGVIALLAWLPPRLGA